MAITENVIVIEPGKMDEVRDSNPDLIVDCWAAWCGPCRTLSPVIDRLAEEYAGRVAVAKLNVDENQADVHRLRIMAVPTILFFKDGELVDQMIGAMPKDKIEEVIRQHY